MRYLTLFLLLPLYSRAQNLVPNGGFEDENICTEYQKNCAPEAWIATSLRANYYFDDQSHAHSGTHFVGLVTGNLVKPGIRSFIRTQLLCRLQRGHAYNLEFFIRSGHAVFDSIAVYFSSIDFLYDWRYFKDISPQHWVKDGLDSSNYNPVNWQRVHFIYKANGDEQYLTIGNFKKGEYINPGHAEFENNVYFFLDDVSLIPADSHEHLCVEADSIRKQIYDENDRHHLMENKIYLYRKHPPSPINLPSTIVTRIDTLLIPDILFATAKYVIGEKEGLLLDSFCKSIRNRIVDSVLIEGHTDSIGKNAYNQRLSANRANAVRNFIKQKILLADDRFLLRFYASTRPVASNGTEAGRQKNRRVEIYLYSHE
jgi:outer membrane protein OmpA-like peptidoglycan-associated protein